MERRTLPEVSLNILAAAAIERGNSFWICRREWLAATGGAAAYASLEACSRTRSTAPSDALALRATAYDQAIYETVRRVLKEYRLDVRGKQILLKPNLAEFEPSSSINTHPILVHAAYEAFLALDAAGVRIGEGPGHRRNTLDLADAAGLSDGAQVRRRFRRSQSR